MKKNIQTTEKQEVVVVSEIRLEVLKDAFDRLHYTYDWNVQLQDTSPMWSTKPEFALNWWACGTKSSQDAREFKHQLDTVIRMVEMLNSLNLRVYDRDDSMITDAELRNHYIDVLADVINDCPTAVDFVEQFLKYDKEPEIEADEGYQPEDEMIDHYTPSATHGDYSPSCPWKAPGMSISDFI